VNEPPQSKSLDNLAMVSTSSPFRPPSLLPEAKAKAVLAHDIRARRISLNINLSYSRSTPLAQFMAAITRYICCELNSPGVARAFKNAASGLSRAGINFHAAAAGHWGLLV
jgi:hypothetical protein